MPDDDHRPTCRDCWVRTDDRPHVCEPADVARVAAWYRLAASLSPSAAEV